MDKISTHNTLSIADFIASLDEPSAKDANVLLEMMQQISGVEPKLWNAGTIGFDMYHYKYESGREGDGFIIGFYPRNNKITIYLMDGTARYTDVLTKLGNHSITGYCLYIKQLSDIHLPILKQILKTSYKFIKDKSKDGHITEILWKAAK